MGPSGILRNGAWLGISLPSPCPASARPLTHACVIEHARKHQHDVVGPVFAVQRHLVLFDHQQVQVDDALHGVKEV